MKGPMLGGFGKIINMKKIFFEMLIKSDHLLVPYQVDPDDGYIRLHL